MNSYANFAYPKPALRKKKKCKVNEGYAGKCACCGYTKWLNNHGVITRGKSIEGHDSSLIGLCFDCHRATHDYCADKFKQVTGKELSLFLHSNKSKL